jgi:superfamily I DNA/RNA helicase
MYKKTPRPSDSGLPAAPATAAWWGLNEEQEKPFLENRHCATIAGPGSGKTRMMVAKIARLVAEYGPTNIMAVTFTKASSNEMKNRLASAYGTEVADQVKIGTFHAIAYRQLMGGRKGHEIKMLREWERTDAILRYRTQINKEMSDREAEYWVSRYQNDTSEAGSDVGKMAVDGYAIYEEYEKYLKKNNKMDMNSLISRCLRMYRSGELKPHNVAHLLIDEYQDSDRVQVSWALEYIKQGTIITVVGDDDQSIYRFRSSLGVEAYRMLRESIPAREFSFYRMGTNYRSAEGIVSHASKAIEKNHDRLEKKIVAHRTDPGVVSQRWFVDRESEAESIVERFLETGKSITVLSRTKAWLFPLKMFCRINQCRFVQYDTKESIVESAHVGRVIAGLRFAATGKGLSNVSHALRAVGIHGDSLASIDGVLHGLKDENHLMDDHLYRKDVVDSLKADDKEVFRDLRECLLDFNDGIKSIDAEAEDKDALIGEFIFNLIDFFMSYTKKTNHLSDLATVQKIMCRYLTGSPLERIKAISKSPKEEDPSDEPAIHMMTLHGSKGLEFDEVWIPGCNEQHLPHSDAKTDDDVEEERRLFYVGMTRARNVINLSSIVNDGSTGSRQYKPSIFLGDAGLEMSDSQDPEFPLDGDGVPGTEELMDG